MSRRISTRANVSSQPRRFDGRDACREWRRIGETPVARRDVVRGHTFRGEDVRSNRHTFCGEEVGSLCASTPRGTEVVCALCAWSRTTRVQKRGLCFVCERREEGGSLCATSSRDRVPGAARRARPGSRRCAGRRARGGPCAAAGRGAKRSEERGVARGTVLTFRAVAPRSWVTRAV